MSHKHPPIFQNTALVLGSVAVFVFAVAFSAFAYNIYQSPVQANSAEDFVKCVAEAERYNGYLENINKQGATLTDSFKKMITASISAVSELRALAIQKDQSKSYTSQDTANCKQILDKAVKTYSDVVAEYPSLAQDKTKSGTQDKSTDKSSTGSAQTTGNDFEFLSKQDYSATAITGLPTSKDCENNQVGQVVVVSKIKDFEPSGDKRIEVAVSTGGFYTKRGILQKISGNYVDKLVEGYNKSTGGRKLDKELVISGLYFPNVPVESALKVQLYSPSWGEKMITITDIPKVSKACETIFVPVYDTQSTDMDVCVHSTDRAKDYSPKKTFVYPKQKEEAKKFQDENKGSIISLGPCQSAAELAKKINGEDSLKQPGQETQGGEEKKGIGIGYDPNPGSTSAGTGGLNPGQTQITSQQQNQYQAEALQAVNEFRRSRGLKEFSTDASIQRVADEQIKKMVAANQCNHVSPTTTENVAGGSVGAVSIKQLVQFWLDEEKETNPQERGHFETLINPELSKVGSAVGVAGGMLCLVQDYM